MTYNTSQNSQEMSLCTECIDNEDFSSYIKNQGSKGQCDFNKEHGNLHQTLTVKDFCEHVDVYFQEKYCPGTVHHYYLENAGEPYDCILSEELEIDDNEALRAIVTTLAENEYYDYSSGEEPFYNDETNYQLITDVQKDEREQEREFEDYWYDNRVSFQWQDFSQSVIYGSRFFNIKEQLDNIFGKIEGYSNDKRRPIYTISKSTPIYRARKLGRGLTAEIVKSNPSQELGAPSAEISISGRMNVQHIPAFYASFSSDVALRELQPYISEEVAIGKFILKRDVKVFDFTVFDKMYDDKYGEKGAEREYDNTRYDVVTRIQEEMSKPVSSDSKSLNYIPTQVLTEYIQERFNIDAIIYFSSLFSASDKKEKRNIVLLNKKFDGGKYNNALSINKNNVSIKSVKNIKYIVEDADDFPF
jgi:hypothetical protein